MQRKVEKRTIENLLLVSLFTTVLLVTPYSSIDPINLPKMSVLGVLSFMLFTLTLTSLRSWNISKNRILISSCILFVLQLFFILAFSGRNLVENFYGVFGRNTGILTYLSFIMVLFVSAVIASQFIISRFILIFLLVGIILISYGLIQHFGQEPFPYAYTYGNKVIGTFGNPNFHSAFMGILGALAFTTILNIELSKIIRIISVLIFLMSIFSINSTHSWQGFFNLVAGIGVAGILLAHKKGWRKLGQSFTIIGILTSGLIGLGLLNQGPLASILSKASLTARRIYWEAALKMLSDHPLTGVGLDGFGDWFRRSRSAQALEFNAGLTSDSAHSVPLDIAAGGGFPLLLIYLGILCLTLYSIVKVVRRGTNLSFGFISISSAWFSYQAQSLISINQIALGFIGWTLSGLIIGYASLENSEVEMEDIKKTFKGSVKRKNSLIFTSFITPIIGLILGCLIALPPFIASNRFYEGLKTSDARVVIEKAYAKPLDPGRLMIAVNILERNKFYKESLQMTKYTSQEFSDSYEVWRTLRSLTNASDVDKSKALKELLRLDPNIKP